MKLLIGIIAGTAVALIGSILISFIPYIPFGPVFLASIVPSLLIFTIVTYQIKPNRTKLMYWLHGLGSLFVISLLAFTIKSYVEYQSVSDLPGRSLNWDAVILFNFIYLFGAALLVSPIGYYAIKWIGQVKWKQ